MIQAWVWCTDLQGGNLVHNCDRASMPHRIPVCVFKHDAIATTYAVLVDRAAAGGAPAVSAPRPSARSAVCAFMNDIRAKGRARASGRLVTRRAIRTSHVRKRLVGAAPRSTAAAVQSLRESDDHDECQD